MIDEATQSELRERFNPDGSPLRSFRCAFSTYSCLSTTYAVATA